MLYDGYQARRKEQEFLVAWQTALLLNAWRGDEKSPVIEVGDLLPWVAKSQKKMHIDNAPPIKPVEPELVKPKPRPKPTESEVDKAVKKYALLKGINLDELTPEELADLTVEAIHHAAGGLFDRAPKGWGNFPTE